MPSVILSDNGVSSGSAGIKTTADSTGSLALQTTTAAGAATTALTLDTSQNATFVGTATATKLIPTGTSVTGNGLYLPAANSLGLSTNGTNAVYIDSSQNVGIGTASPGARLDVAGTSNIRHTYTGAPAGILFGQYDATGNAQIQNQSTSGIIALATNNSERMRIDSSGNLLVGATATSNGGKFLVAQPTAASQSAVFQSTNATAGNNYGVLINYTVTSPNGTSNQFLSCSDSTQVRAEFRSNGGLANFSANNVNLSDVRTKTDIQDASSYLAKICAIPVRTFKYKDQTDDLLNLGCIAQEVETVAPELVDASGFGETPEDGVPLKAIYQTDLQYALMKCIQEQQALITALTARIETLENKT